MDANPDVEDRDADMAVLLNEWEILCVHRDVAEDRAADLRPVLEAYAGPGRHYHDVRHVADCLRELEEVRTECDDALAAGAALLFHDCVYDPTRPDNEERSADVAAALLAPLGWGRRFLEAVRSLILATKHAAPPETNDGAIVVDIDLSILGKPPEVFDAYERAIRREYGHVPDGAFAAGRAEVLRRFLARPTIYATPTFRERYEVAARQNLRRSLSQLERR